GLAISSRLVSLMGGQLLLISPLYRSEHPGVAEEAHGPGSDFTFTIPFALDDEPAKEESPASETPLGRRPARPLRILLVDDNRVNQELMVTLLGMWGHSVDVAGDGFEAVRLLGLAD